ncbi:eukaryotic translation initiation factor 2 beta subunit [Eremomyces bilateralis CBS 781.70]|uniref:Eukaryotic translation initiation factor 2 beta subunit n=1 Tax=Eremomyces bilateralis CBS 781.70 TaxID=1392243 RepID=A0A6G1G2Q6_9PEZI|nr:eukaryotic translation initiation factor 2 beta subunit [Eremomyces bilateralis CBS 781.70]KAF1812397.1 eukaryotic translation initiation factor 2 beta subunit [Eremomyces bilateralis CBS 781.70]
MADTTTERPKRKSVAFSEGATIVDTDGQVTEMNGHTEKTTAESHSHPSPSSNPTVPNGAAGDGEVDEVTAMMAGLAKKKKKKSSKSKEGVEADGEKAENNGEFDPSALKKKKKKKKAVDADDFEAKLAEADAGDKGGEEKVSAKPPAEEQTGDFEQGTGIWAHDAKTPVVYSLLLSRFFTQLQSHHPDLFSSGHKSYKIPPPQCLREGNKKTIFANISEICKRMKRTDEHVIQFLFAELGTNGSVDGSRRLVIKGRFQQKQIENVLRRYIVEYVTCKTCRSPDTELVKGENRLSFITCNSCGSRRSVTAIKTGFSAQVGKRRRQRA